ncbi:hypothetical protein P7C73_g1971, partial [Tremellales sp. Uapishka_1]
MSGVYVFGSNVSGDLDPSIDLPILHDPHLLEYGRLGELQWHGWSCTIFQDEDDECEIWGIDALIPREERRGRRRLPRISKVIGVDRPLGFLDAEGWVHRQAHGESGRRGEKAEGNEQPEVERKKGEGFAKSIERFDEVRMTNDRVLSFRRHQGLSLSPRTPNSDPDFLSPLFLPDSVSSSLHHPLIDISKPLRIYSTESRFLIHTLGAAHHLLELSFPAPACEPRWRMIDDFEGVQITKIVTGAGDRFALLTEVGDGWILGPSSRGGAPELVEIKGKEDGEVRDIGLGSGWEIVVLDGDVWVRGKSESIV